MIEDEDALRDLVAEGLREAGYRVLLASDGPTGLRLLQSAGRIDLVVTDVGLPGGLNGRQVVDAARAFRPRLKVLFVTGFAGSLAVDRALVEAGMQLMTKPFVSLKYANPCASTGTRGITVGSAQTVLQPCLRNIAMAAGCAQVAWRGSTARCPE